MQELWLPPETRLCLYSCLVGAGARQAWHTVGAGSCGDSVGSRRTPSLLQITKHSWETQSNQNWIQKQFLVINNCRPEFLVQRRTASQLLIKTNTSTFRQKANLRGKPQSCLWRPSGSRYPTACRSSSGDPSCWETALSLTEPQPQCDPQEVGREQGGALRQVPTEQTQQESQLRAIHPTPAPTPDPGSCRALQSEARGPDPREPVGTLVQLESSVATGPWRRDQEGELEHGEKCAPYTEDTECRGH